MSDAFPTTYASYPRITGTNELPESIICRRCLACGGANIHSTHYGTKSESTTSRLLARRRGNLSWPKSLASGMRRTAFTQKQETTFLSCCCLHLCKAKLQCSKFPPPSKTTHNLLRFRQFASVSHACDSGHATRPPDVVKGTRASFTTIVLWSHLRMHDTHWLCCLLANGNSLLLFVVPAKSLLDPSLPKQAMPAEASMPQPLQLTRTPIVQFSAL